MKVRYTGDHYPVLFRRGEIYEVMSIEEGMYRLFSPSVGEDGLFSPVDFQVVEAQPAPPVLEMREL